MTWRIFMLNIVAYFAFLGTMTGIAVVLFYGLKTIKLI